MGLCATREELTQEELQRNAWARGQSRGIDRSMQRSGQDDKNIRKVLLLGTGGSGKSTLFKQMQKIYGTGFDERERKEYTIVVYHNMIVSIKTLILYSHHYGGVQNEESKRVVCEASEEEDRVDLCLGQHMKRMWSEPAVQLAYENRTRFYLHESTAYYFSRIDEIMQPDYIPNTEDVLRSRAPTTGIIECTYNFDGTLVRMLDVGGQRNERKKWAHCFEGVTTVLFVVALTDYDQVLYEDQRTSRLVDALELWEEISNSQWFPKTPMILFLNKRDLFAEQIQRVPLGCYFPHYTGSTYNEATGFMQDMFLEKYHGKKAIYSHFTCAMDTDHIHALWDDLKDIVIRKALEDVGLLG